MTESSNTTGGPFWVSTDDNFHFMDASERARGPSFATYEAAVEECRRIVDASLRHLNKPGTTAEQLYDDYMDFGADPFITPVPPGAVHFSAWGYAEARAKEIAADV